jgi:hypothetical protein
MFHIALYSLHGIMNKGLIHIYLPGFWFPGHHSPLKISFPFSDLLFKILWFPCSMFHFAVEMMAVKIKKASCPDKSRTDAFVCLIIYFYAIVKIN